MAVQNKYLAWKCANPECKKVFYLPGRVSKEIRPAPTRMSFVDETTREVKESPCCPLCYCVNFEPFLIDVNKEVV